VTGSRTPGRRMVSAATPTKPMVSSVPRPPAQMAARLPEMIAPTEMITTKAVLDTMPARVSAQPASVGVAPDATSRR
jgi:hypothetical protein